MVANEKFFVFSCLLFYGRVSSMPAGRRLRPAGYAMIRRLKTDVLEVKSEVPLQASQTDIKSQSSIHSSPSSDVVRHISYLFLVSAKVIIAITAVAKVITLYTYPPALDLIDAVTTMRFSHLILFAAFIEIALLVTLCLRVNQLIKTLSVLYFGLATGAYRIAAHIADQAWCPCLGSFGSWASMTQHQVNMLLNAIVIYLVVGALISMFIFYKDPALVKAK